jgi:hypothetical protein
LFAFIRHYSALFAFLWGQEGTAKEILMTDYEKTEMAKGKSNGAFRFLPLFLGFPAKGNWAKAEV